MTVKAPVVDDSKAIRTIPGRMLAGANEYVMKPFTRDILVEKLEMAGAYA